MSNESLFGAQGYSPDKSRDRLLAALSAIGEAAIGIAETLKQEGMVDQALAEGKSWINGGPIPLEEEAVEPLIDALRCVLHAVGYPTPFHRIGAALDRFSDGDFD